MRYVTWVGAGRDNGADRRFGFGRARGQDQSDESAADLCDVHRGKLDKPAPASVAEHDEISEVYHVISGAATLVLGPDILNRRRRPATGRSTALATTARRLGTAWPTRSRPAMSW